MSNIQPHQNRFHGSQTLEPPSLLRPQMVEKNEYMMIVDLDVVGKDAFNEMLSIYLQSTKMITRTGNSDLEWFASRPPELSRYKNKYVAILKEKVIGFGDTVKHANDMAQQTLPGADPLIAFIEPNPDMMLSLSNAKTLNRFSNKRDRTISRLT
jgi:hypothetical protein